MNITYFTVPTNFLQHLDATVACQISRVFRHQSYAGMRKYRKKKYRKNL